jgi:predicted negative regulator of RcsB-dependent stress response
MAEHGAGHEAEEVKEVVWTYAGWAVIIFICIGAGVFIGYEMWGQATTLQAQLTEQIETVNRLKNERETIKSQLALASRDKDACQRLLANTQGGAAAAGGGTPPPAPPTGNGAP